MSEPRDPLGTLADAAISQHEMYLSWIEAGFTPEEALELTKAVIQELIRGVVG